jgi:hypothetical protein
MLDRLVSTARSLVRKRRVIGAYLRQPLVLTRRAFLGLALAAGLAIGIGAVAVLGLADERSQRSAEGRAALSRELARERAARKASDALGRRLSRQESPSDRELARRVRRFLRTLDRHPAHLRRLRAVGLSRELTARGVAEPSATNPGAPPPAASRPPRRRRRPAAPGPTPSSPAPTTTTPAAPPPRPLVDVPAPTVTTPAGTLTVPTFCARPVGGIGC